MGNPLSVLLPHTGPLWALLIGILALFGLGLWQWARLHARLGREEAAARRVSVLLRPATDESTLSVMLGRDHATLAGTLMVQMVRHSGLAFARPGDVLEPLVDQVRQDSVAHRALPNLLLLFGLISTVVGLIGTLGQLGPSIQNAMSAADPGQVAQNLGVTLREMSSAFAGTFWGVATAFLLQVAQIFTARRAQRLIRALDGISLKYAPQLYPAGSEKQLESLQALMERSGTYLKETQDAIQQTSQQFSQVLTEAGTTITESLKTLQRTSQDISVALKQASGDVKLSSERLTTAVDALQQHKNDYRNIYTQFNEMFERSMTALGRHSDQQLGEIRAVHTEFGRTGADIVAEIFKVSEKLTQVTGDLAVSQNVMTSAAGEVYSSLRGGFDTLQSRLDDTLKTYTTEVNVVGTAMDALRPELKGSAEAVTALERTLRGKDDAERTRARDQDARDAALREQINALTQILTQVQRPIEQGVTAMAAPPAWEADLRATLDAHRANLEALRAAVQEDLRSLGEALGPVQDAQVAAREQRAEHAETLRQLRDVLTQQLDATARVGRHIEQALPSDAVAVQRDLRDAVQRLNLALPLAREAGPAA